MTRAEPPPELDAGLRRSLARAQTDVAHALDREFERQFHKVYGTSPDRDPALQTLFYTLASEISRIHEDAQRVFPEAVLDDLVAGLGTAPRLAEAAQTIVQFDNITSREWITPQTALIGQSAQGDRIPFAPDAAFQVSTARVRFAAMAERDSIQTLSGVEYDGRVAPPARFEATTGVRHPTLYLGVACDHAHLSHQSLFVDVVPSDGPLAALLRHSVWRVLGPDGTVHRDGAMRSVRSRGGTRALLWFDDDGPHEDAPHEVDQVLNLGRGVYGHLVYRFPFVPAERRFVGKAPPGLGRLFSQVVPAGGESVLEQPLTWIEVMLPPGARGWSNQLRGVHLHSMSASNAEVLSEIVSFSREGQAVAHSPEGLDRRHVLGVLSVQGSSPYVNAASLGPADAGEDRGSWSYRNKRIEITPARAASGRLDTHAHVRILFCDGEEANNLDVGSVNRVDTTHLDNVGLRVSNLMLSKGGMPPPPYSEAKVRFAAALRTRERVVTVADFQAVAKAFDARIKDVSVEVTSAVTRAGLQVAERVTVTAERDLFADPESELGILADRLEEYLQERVGMGRVVRVEVAK